MTLQHASHVTAGDFLFTPSTEPTAPNAAEPVRKVNGKALALSVLGRCVNPVELWRAFRLQCHRKANRRTFDDAQLSLYAQMLPSDFLHYGFFDKTDQTPEEMSLMDIASAQIRYADLLLEQAGSKADPVLDVGCGMGGLSRMLLERGYRPVPLTPDRLQAAYVTRQLPDVGVVRCKLENLPVAEHAHAYGTIYTSESLQYLKLDKALPVLAGILKKGGRWVASDYFLTHDSPDKTCHRWTTFERRVAEAGWKITQHRDITGNVLPTLAFLHMLATRFGLPLMNFTMLRLRRKQPGLHHLLGGLLSQLEGVAADNVGLINPVQFARDRQYLLLTMERARTTTDS